ncbi:MAG: hypothetical protein V1826_01845, partial [bacterium]
MEEEARDSVKSPANWREYLKNAGETMRLFRWTWGVIPTESRRKSRILLVGLLFWTVAKIALPRFAQKLAEAAGASQSEKTIASFLGIVLCILVSRYFDYVFGVAREWILGLNWKAVDRHITESFFGKSVGQHIQESSRLSVSNIDKGRWRLLDMQGMLLFDGIPALLSLLFTFVFLWVFLPFAGGIMTVGLVAYLVWTLYLNHRVMVVCSPLDAAFRKLNRYRVERWEKVERVKVSGRCAEELRKTDDWFDEVIGQDRKF